MRISQLTILGTVLLAGGLAWSCTPDSGGTRSSGGGSGEGGSDGGVFGGTTTGPDGAPQTTFSQVDGSVDPSTTTSDACASRRVQVTRTPVDVVIFVDQSFSMGEPFGNGTRWQAIRDALISQPNGIVTQLEGIVRFGLVLYTGPISPDSVGSFFGADSDGGTGIGGFIPTGSGGGSCPQLTTVDPALNNRGTIATEFNNAMPSGETPTANALKQILDGFNFGNQGPDQQKDRPIFLLATDGEPDTCSNPTADGNSQAVQSVVNQVTRAYDMGIETFLLDVGNGVSENVKQQVANAGQGKAPGAMPGAKFWTANNPQGLQQALVEIVGGQVSCEIELAGKIRNLSDACSAGTVTIDGQKVPCGDNGWKATDANHIKLVGQACEQIKSNPNVQVNASFDCGTIVQ